MRKKIYFLLSTLILLLGFGGCKSSKKAQAEEDEQATWEKVRQDDPAHIRVLYGAPPARNMKIVEE